MNPQETLSNKSRKIWNDIERCRSRELNRADYTVIENFCNAVDIYDEAMEEIRENGFSNEYNQVAPAVTVANKSANNIRHLYKSISKFLYEKPTKTNLKSVKNF